MLVACHDAGNCLALAFDADGPPVVPWLVVRVQVDMPGPVRSRWNREYTQRHVHYRDEASIDLGILCRIRNIWPADFCPEKRADVDTDIRLGDEAHGLHFGQARSGQIGARKHDPRGARGVGARQPDCDFSRRDALSAGRSAFIQIRRQSFVRSAPSIVRAGCFELRHFVAEEAISETAGSDNREHSPRDTRRIVPATNA